jgi:hypothetical protein
METTEDSPEPEIPHSDPENETSPEDANGQGTSSMFHNSSPSPEPYDPPPPYGWDDDTPGPPYQNDFGHTQVQGFGNYGAEYEDAGAVFVDPRGIQQFYETFAESGPSGRSLVDQLLRPRTDVVQLGQGHDPGDDGDHTVDYAEEEMDERQDDYDNYDYDEDAHEFGDDDAILMEVEMGPYVLPPPVYNPLGNQVERYFDIWWATGQREMGAGPSDADLANTPPGGTPLFPGYSSESSQDEGSPLMGGGGLGGSHDDDLMGDAGSGGSGDGEEPLVGSAGGLGGSHDNDLMDEVVFGESHDHEASSVESEVSSDESQGNEEPPAQAHPVGAQVVQDLGFHPSPSTGHSPTSLTSSFEDFNRDFTSRLQLDELNEHLMTTLLSSVELPDMATVEPPANEGEEAPTNFVEPSPQGTKRTRSQSRSQSPEVKRTRFGRSEFPEATRRVLTIVGQSVRNQRAFLSRGRFHGHQRGIQRVDQLIARCHAVLEDPNATAVAKEEAKKEIERLVNEINKMNDEIGSPRTGSDRGE